MEKFTKIKNIGKGNMGACALARNNEDGRYYVIKQVDLTKLNKKERQQSLNEAKVLSSLRHPNIINYVDSFLARKSDHLCIVMEFADGGDLSNRIKANNGINFSETQILDWFIQIVLSLHYVHQRKILHRDVKTQNIFLTQDNLCKLGDFGIARTLNSTYDQASTFVGTPYYLSPELILERPYDHMSDVWAVGVVLYELMALRHPFNANDMKSLMYRILKVQYDPPPTMYSNDLRNIVARLLVKDPLQRIRLGEILELPVVVRRVRTWMEGGALPPKYVAALARNKLLPPHLLAGYEGGGEGGAGSAALPPVGNNRSPEAISPAHNMNAQQQQQYAAPPKQQPVPSSYQPSNNNMMPQYGQGGGGAKRQSVPSNYQQPQPPQHQAVGGGGYGQGGGGGGYGAQEYALRPKPSPVPGQDGQRYGGAYHLPAMGGQQQQQAMGGGGGGQQYRPGGAAAAAPMYGRGNNAGGGGGGNGGYVYGGQGGGVAAAMQQPRVYQPSVQQSNADIQAMLQRAAVERAQRARMGYR